MNRVLFFLVLFWGIPAFANTWTFLEVEYGRVEAKKYHILRDPYTPEEGPNDWVGGGAFTDRLRLIGHTPSNTSMFWQNRLHFSGTESQIRHGGWEFEVGLSKRDVSTMPGWLGTAELLYYHHSQHVMERARTTRDYPLENSTVLRLEWKRRE